MCGARWLRGFGMTGRMTGGSRETVLNSVAKGSAALPAIVITKKAQEKFWPG
jgi:hypothetical protein